MKNIEYSLIKDGFCILPKIFSSKIIELAKEGLWDVIEGNYETGVPPENRFWNKGDDPKKIIKIDKPHLCNNNIRRLITNFDFGQYLGQISDARTIQIWHSQLIWKPPGGGEKGHAGWHCDKQYWPFWEPGKVFTAWIALSNVTENAGPVRYIVGSNHWDDISNLDFFDKNLVAQGRLLDKKYPNRTMVNANIERGQVIVHSSKVYHCSGANNSKRPRIGMVVHFCTDEALRKPVSGDLRNYLNQMDDETVCPTIYKF